MKDASEKPGEKGHSLSHSVVWANTLANVRDFTPDDDPLGLREGGEAKNIRNGM
jgi:hypothetical protein